MLRQVLAVLFAFALTQSAWAQDVLSPSQFRDAAIALVQAQAPNVEVERVGELGAVVRRPVEGGKPQEFNVNFDSGYRDYTASPERLNDILGRWSRLILAPSQERGYERIISVLRHRDMANVVLGGQQVSLVWRPFAGDLIELLAFDSAEQIHYATTEDLQQIEITADAAWALTPENVRTRMGPLVRESLSPSMDLLSGDNGITPSLLTVPDFCTPETAGKLYLVADRNLIVIGDARSEANRQEFAAFARAASLGGDSLSATPLECRDGRLREAGD
jgi:hypothetical protein